MSQKIVPNRSKNGRLTIISECMVNFLQSLPSSVIVIPPQTSKEQYALFRSVECVKPVLKLGQIILLLQQ